MYGQLERQTTPEQQRPVQQQDPAGRDGDVPHPGGPVALGVPEAGQRLAGAVRAEWVEGLAAQPGLVQPLVVEDVRVGTAELVTKRGGAQGNAGPGAQGEG